MARVLLILLDVILCRERRHRERVEIAGIGSEPDRAWVRQCGRQVTDPIDGCLRGKRFLLHDRDPLFGEAFRQTPTPSALSGPSRNRA